MADMNYRTSFEYPHPNRKLVAQFIRAAKSSGERKVWRDFLNTEAYHKVKTPPESAEGKKVRKAVEAAQPSKKK